ncbi:hypothetical protein AAE478_009870 [Parahypoxylon ruwenzoriense]
MEQPSSEYPNQRAPGKEHIPLYPRGFIAVRIIQLIIAIICLGLSAFGIAYLVFSGDALTLFTSIATLITSIYCLVAHCGPPKAFNYWAILGLDIFLVIFWLISFAILAAQVTAAFALYSSYKDYYDYYDYYSYHDYDTALTTYGACLAAAAGLGGVEFVTLHRHRKAGLKAMPVSNSPVGVAIAPGKPAGGGKFQMHLQATQVHPQQFVPVAEPPPLQQDFYQLQSPSPISGQPTSNTYVHPQQVNPGHPVYETPEHARQYHPAQ